MTEPSQYFKGRTVQEQMNEVIGYVDVRSAEVATNAIAADVAQVHQDMLDADADASAAAASAAAAAGTLANAVKKTGESSQSIAGDIAVAGNLTGGSVTVPTPTNNTDAANKKYVDDHHDATKIDITAINSYAVGLTGNQGPIAGVKEFSEPIKLNGVNNMAVTGDASSDTSQWVCLYKTAPVVGTYYWNALALVTKRRQGFSGANYLGLLEMIVTPNSQYVAWLLCGTGLQLADFKVIRNANNEVKVCVTNTSGINNQFVASIIGHSSGIWIPDNSVITDAAELSLLSAASPSTVIALR